MIDWDTKHLGCPSFLASPVCPERKMKRISPIMLAGAANVMRKAASFRFEFCNNHVFLGVGKSITIGGLSGW